MKNIIKYMMLLAGVAMIATACKKELTLSDVEGSVSLNVEMESVTRADDNASGENEQFVPEKVLVRIYRGARTTEETGDQLVRRYNKMEDIPNPLYLMADNYTVKVDAGDTSNKSFKQPSSADDLKEKLCYSGAQGFVITKQTNTNITVACKTINTKFNVGFDIRDSEKDHANDGNYNEENKPTKYENRLLSNVKITVAAIETSATTVEELKVDITAQKSPKLEFTGEELNPTDLVAGQTAGVGSGYFLMPEGVTTLVWAFEGVHEKDGEVAQMGKVSVLQGYAYTVNFKYSRTPDGYAGITVVVDDKVEIVEDDFYFKPQPQISGSIITGQTPTPILAEGANVLKQGGSLSLVCESINDLTDISLGGVEFYNDGEVVANHGITGLAATKESKTKVSFTISEAYFNTLKGSTQNLRFVMTDTEDEPYEQILTFKKRGIVADNNEQSYDLWRNTATIKAYIPETDVTSVEIKYRRADIEASKAIPMTVTKQTDGVTWVATTSSPWDNATPTTNRNGKSIYIPDSSLGIYPNNQYIYELWVAGEKVDEYTLMPTVTQPIQDANFQNTTLYCYNENLSSGDMPTGEIWGSGNNNFTKDDPLCRPGTNGSNSYAHLSSCMAGAFGVELLAAGNLFTGNFKRPSTAGTVSFGIKYEWKARPTSLRFKYWGSLGTVDEAGKTTFIKKGDPDYGSVLVAIVDWSARHGVTSGTGDPSGMWSPEDGAEQEILQNSGKIIGYGVAYPTGTTNDTGALVEYEVPIVYYDVFTNPSNSTYSLVISFATSRYGDYMNGCSNSNMYIDDIEWGYSTNFQSRFKYDTTQKLE